MRKATFAGASRFTAFVRQLLVAGALAGVVMMAALFGTGIAAAWADATPSTPYTGPDYTSITGWRVGAPGEGEVSYYGGSHKHLWVEQQLYGAGVVSVPHIDTGVQQSR